MARVCEHLRDLESWEESRALLTWDACPFLTPYPVRTNTSSTTGRMRTSVAGESGVDDFLSTSNPELNAQTVVSCSAK